MLQPRLLAVMLLFGSCLIAVQPTSAQSLLDLVEEEETTDYAIGTFKTTRVINGHSVQSNGKKQLQFMIMHRFGMLNSGWRNLFGVDNATVRFHLEYGVTDWLDIGIGRSSFQKTYDAMAKAKVLRQSSGAKSMPISLSAFCSIAMNTSEWPEPDRPNYFSSRLSYTGQLLVARKFTDGFSAQLTPTVVHRNLVSTSEDKNDVFALGIGARQKITQSLTINVEYFYVFPDQIISPIQGQKVRDALSIGIDLETGGHVFQLHLTNSRGMVERFFVTETTGNWLDNGIHFGFNISRGFALGKE